MRVIAKQSRANGRECCFEFEGAIKSQPPSEARIPYGIDDDNTRELRKAGHCSFKNFG